MTRSTTLKAEANSDVEDEIVRLAVEKQGKDGSRQNRPANDLVRVSVLVVGGAVGAHSHHQIANVEGERQIQHLHYCVVENQSA